MRILAILHKPARSQGMTCCMGSVTEASSVIKYLAPGSCCRLTLLYSLTFWALYIKVACQMSATYTAAKKQITALYSDQQTRASSNSSVKCSAMQQHVISQIGLPGCRCSHSTYTVAATWHCRSVTLNPRLTTPPPLTVWEVVTKAVEELQVGI